MSEAGKLDFSFIGPVQESSVTIGDYNTVIQHNGLSPTEAAEPSRCSAACART